MKTHRPKKLLALLLTLVMVLSTSMTAFADGSSAILTNFIASLSRDVEQNEKDLLYRNINYTVVDSEGNETKYEDVDVYPVDDPEGITVSYDATMNMTNLELNSTYLTVIKGYASSQAGGSYSTNDWGAWEALLYCYEWIENTTYIDLVFKMDVDVEVSEINTSELADSISLVSEMFTFDSTYSDDRFSNGLEVDSDNNTLTIRCWWDSDKAEGYYDEERTDCDYALDPMIYLYNVELPITSTWGNDSDGDGDEGNNTVLVIVNDGSVSGMMYGSSGTNYDTYLGLTNGWEIYGGIEYDTFILTTDNSVKVSSPGISKKIWVDSDNNVVVDDGELLDSDFVDAGSTVTFQLTSNVPDYLLEYLDFEYTKNDSDVTVIDATTTEDSSYVLVFHDVLDSSFTLNSNSITVTIDGKALNDKYYEVTIPGTACQTTDDDGNTAGGCTFEVSIDLATLYANGIIDEGDIGNAVEIVVTYTATLSADATAGCYDNDAWVTYPDGESEDDKVDVYTYGVKVYKYGSEDVETTTTDEDGNEVTTTEEVESALEGAGFVLFKYVEATDVTSDTNFSSGGYYTYSEGNGYTEVTSENTYDSNTTYYVKVYYKKTTTTTTDDEGNETSTTTFEWVEDLYVLDDNGNETSTYNATVLYSDKDGNLQFEGLEAGTYYLLEVVTPDGYVSSGSPIEITVPVNTGTSYYASTSVENSKIPETGGMGTNLIYLAGVGLVLLAGVVLVTRKRRSAEVG